MTKINDLWLYDQAEQEVAKIDSRLKSTPNRARLNKLHSFLSEQQSAVTNISKQIDARGALIGKLSAQCHELERRLELEVSEFGTMEKDRIPPLHGRPAGPDKLRPQGAQRCHGIP